MKGLIKGICLASLILFGFPSIICQEKKENIKQQIIKKVTILDESSQGLKIMRDSGQIKV